MNEAYFLFFFRSMHSSKYSASGEFGFWYFLSIKDVKILLSVNLYPNEPILVMPRSLKKSCTLKIFVIKPDYSNCIMEFSP